MTDDQIHDRIWRAVQARGLGKTICPSEVARSFGPGWRDLMPDVRRVAQDMAEAGLIRVTQKGQTVHAHRARGPIRLGLAGSNTSA